MAPELTPAEVVARAEAIGPTLIARQAETEKRTYYAEDTHEAFREAGFYRILVPKRYGGHEFGIDTFMKVAVSLIRGCPSTGWMYTLGAAHAHAVASIFPQHAQDEIFTGPDFICPATVVPSGEVVRDGDEWVLNGVWRYCSGVPYATHFLGHTIVSPDGVQPPGPMLFIAPRSQWERLDDWGGYLGQKGSGSHSISITDGRVPTHFSMPTHLSQMSTTGGTPGLELHGNPMYGGGLLSFMVLEDAVLAVGMALSALDAYEELMKARTTTFPPIVPRTQDPDFQYWYGRAAGKIATAEAAFHDAVRQWQELAAQGSAAFTKERELRLSTICREVVRLCWNAVEEYLFPTAGSSAIRDGERVERVWRDLSMLHSHAGVAVYLTAIAPREYAMARFDVTPDHGADAEADANAEAA